MRTLFLGEINPDLVFSGLKSQVITDREVLARDFGLRIGSSTAICACAFSALGGDASLAGLIGDDFFGTFMLDELSRYGVSTEYVLQDPSVRTGVTACLNHENTRTQVTFLGAIGQFDGNNVRPDTLAEFEHIHISSVFIQERLLQSVPRILKQAKKRGLTTSVDTQWDPQEQWTKLPRILPHVDTLFVNQVELSAIVDAYGEPEKLSSMERGLTVVVKKGRDGAELRHPGGQLESVPARPVRGFVDTTGAGDNFDAGYLFAHYGHGTDKKFALDFGSAVAAASCTFVGGVSETKTYRNVVEEKGL